MGLGKARSSFFGPHEIAALSGSGLRVGRENARGSDSSSSSQIPTLLTVLDPVEMMRHLH